MNRRSQDSTDELLRALRASLDREEQADDQATPDDVFADNSLSMRERMKQDEEIAAFDSYMAALLGEIVPSTSESVTEKENAKKNTKAKKKKTAPKKDAPVMEPVTEDEAVELADEEEPEEDMPALPVSEETDHEAEQVSEAVADDELPQPDMQVELPGEMLGEEVPTIDAVYVTEEEGTVLGVEAQVIEQLRIPSDSFAAATPDLSELQAQDELPGGLSDIEVSARSNDQVQDALSEAVDENGMPLPLDAATSELVVEAEQQTEDESALREGDIVLDADDEIPQPAQTEEIQHPAQEAEEEPKASVVAPVSSPLDAARATAQREEAEARPKQSPLDAIAAERANARGNVTPLGGAPIFGRNASRERTLTDDDVELLLDLGYENNLSQKVGSQRIETVKYRRVDDEEQRKRLKHTHGCPGEEYTGHAQNNQIKEIYQKNIRGATARLVAVVLLALLTFASDVFPLFREELPDVFAAVPATGTYGVAGLALLLGMTLLCLPQLKRGVMGLVRFSPVPAMLTVVLLAFTLVYDVIGLFLPECGVLLNFPTAISLLLLAVGERLNVGRESATFDVVSAYSRKIGLDAMQPKKKKVVRDGHIVKIINDDGDRTLWRVRPTEQIAGYFRRTSRPTARYAPLAPLLTGVLLGAVIVAVMTLLILERPDSAAVAFLLTLQLAMPVSTLISYAYPMLLTAKELAKSGCAIIGESAVDEYTGDKTLLFDDTEMFRSKSSTEITIRGGGDTRKYIRYAKRLFRTIGGTLHNVTTSDLSQETYEDRVEILRVMDEGVMARIDGKVNILAGTSAFMTQNGIRVPGENAELLVRRHVESCILYLAFDGKLRLGYEIDYRISGRFEQAAEQLARFDTAVAIESHDPSIHAEFLARSRDKGHCPIRVIKPVRFERATEAQMIDSGLVATRSARDIAQAVVACERLAQMDRQLMNFHRVATLIGVVLAAALSLLSMVSGGITFAVALFQLAWCIPTMILTRKNILNEQDQQQDNDNRNRESMPGRSEDLL